MGLRSYVGSSWKLRAENDRLRGLLGVGTRDEAVSPWEPTLFVEDEVEADGAAVTAVDRHSPKEAKIAVFRSLFVGREDVHARRWENPRSAKAGWSPAVRGGWANSKKPGREYLPFSDEVVGSHLSGEVHAGLYPLLRGDACRLLVCDFDGTGWLLDALAYLDAARAVGIPVALERSRSGDGGHVWTFFSGPVAASLARQVGAHLLREAMTIRAELDLASYDRLFPAQDFMPKGSFGNLIALPLNGECRKRETTVFLDPSKLEPFEDQWAFLSSLAPVSPKALADIARSIPPIGAGPEDATYRRPSTSGSPTPPRTDRGRRRRHDEHRAHWNPPCSAVVAQTRGLATQPCVLREGTSAVFHLEYPPVRPLLWRNPRPSPDPTWDHGASCKNHLRGWKLFGGGGCLP